MVTLYFIFHAVFNIARKDVINALCHIFRGKQFFMGFQVEEAGQFRKFIRGCTSDSGLHIRVHDVRIDDDHINGGGLLALFHGQAFAKLFQPGLCCAVEAPPVFGPDGRTRGDAAENFSAGMVLEVFDKQARCQDGGMQIDIDVFQPFNPGLAIVSDGRAMLGTCERSISTLIGFNEHQNKLLENIVSVSEMGPMGANVPALLIITIWE